MCVVLTAQSSSPPRGMHNYVPCVREPMTRTCMHNFLLPLRTTSASQTTCPSSLWPMPTTQKDGTLTMGACRQVDSMERGGRANLQTRCASHLSPRRGATVKRRHNKPNHQSKPASKPNAGWAPKPNKCLWSGLSLQTKLL